MPRALRALPSRIWIALLVVLVVAPMGQLHVISREMSPAKADLVPIWLGSRVALQGGDPYSDDTTRKIQTAYYGRPLRLEEIQRVNKMAFAYPAHTLILFSPVASLSWPVVRLIFLILLPLLTAVSIPLWLRVAGIDLPAGHLAPVLLLTLASWPVSWGVHQIQPTLIVFALAAAGCYFVKRGHGNVAGILFAIATIKPQLVGPLLAWLCLRALLRRQWNFLFSFATSLAALLVSAAWLVPGWVGKWRFAMADYAVYRHLEPLPEMLFGRWLGLVIVGAVAIAVFVVLWRNRGCALDSPSFGLSCALALAATACLLPTEVAMVYNNVLLAPGLYILLFCDPGNRIAAMIRPLMFAQLMVDFSLVPLSVVAETISKPNHFWESLPFRDFLLPILITAFLIVEMLPGKAAVSADSSEAVSRFAEA